MISIKIISFLVNVNTLLSFRLFLREKCPLEKFPLIRELFSTVRYKLYLNYKLQRLKIWYKITFFSNIQIKYLQLKIFINNYIHFSLQFYILQKKDTWFSTYKTLWITWFIIYRRFMACKCYDNTCFYLFS